ncbi:MAG TPA: response regulator transcription factor [Acidimicrobiia bacterium]|nr:response regulator transcription factor [Acidimicrobiia bacterium]
MVVDDLALVRVGIAAVLAGRGIDVIAETRSGREAVSVTALDHPDLVVIGTPADLALDDTARRVLRVRPRPVVVALLGPNEPAIVRYLLAMGVRAVALRAADRAELGEAIDAAMKGVQHVARALHPALAGPAPLAPLADREEPLLSAREREVLSLLAQGRSNREIAAALSVTLATVKSHLVRIYAKLEASNRNQALGRAVELGLLR